MVYLCCVKQTLSTGVHSSPARGAAALRSLTWNDSSELVEDLER